jgi:hypothetical protein
MRKILFLLAMVFSLNGMAQSIVYRSNNTITVLDYNFFAGNSFRLPVYKDTVQANQAYTLDSCGKIIYTYNGNKLWFRACSPKRWLAVGTGGGPVTGAVDSLKRVGDSIFAQKDSQFIFQYKDSIGGSGATLQDVINNGDTLTQDNAIQTKGYRLQLNNQNDTTGGKLLKRALLGLDTTYTALYNGNNQDSASFMYLNRNYLTLANLGGNERSILLTNKDTGKLVPAIVIKNNNNSFTLLENKTIISSPIQFDKNISLKKLSTDPVTDSTHAILYADSLGNFVYKNDTAKYKYVFKSNLLTSDRIYTLPDENGTLGYNTGTIHQNGLANYGTTYLTFYDPVTTKNVYISSNNFFNQNRAFKFLDYNGINGKANYTLADSADVGGILSGRLTSGAAGFIDPGTFADTVLANSGFYSVVNTGGGTLNFPNPSGATGRWYLITNGIGLSSGALQVNPGGSDPLAASGTPLSSGGWEIKLGYSYLFWSDGVNWNGMAWVISNFP